MPQLFLGITFSLLLVAPLPGQLTETEKKQTIAWILQCEHPEGGFYYFPHGSQTVKKSSRGLRYTTGAVRSLGFLGASVPHKENHQQFVLQCYDKQTGGFAEPGQPTNVITTAVGIMAALELGISRKQIARSLSYLKEHARSFEEQRLAAAACEMWGVKNAPVDIKPWLQIARDQLNSQGWVGKDQPDIRMTGSVIAMLLRLGTPAEKLVNANKIRLLLTNGQEKDGGFGAGTGHGDLDSSYRVMRALMLFGSRPRDPQQMEKFIQSHRTSDGGYTMKLEERPNMSAVYYATIILKWLKETK